MKKTIIKSLIITIIICILGISINLISSYTSKTILLGTTNEYNEKVGFGISLTKNNAVYIPECDWPNGDGSGCNRDEYVYRREFKIENFLIYFSIIFIIIFVIVKIVFNKKETINEKNNN